MRAGSTTTWTSMATRSTTRRSNIRLRRQLPARDLVREAFPCHLPFRRVLTHRWPSMTSSLSPAMHRSSSGTLVQSPIPGHRGWQQAARRQRTPFRSTGTCASTPLVEQGAGTASGTSGTCPLQEGGSKCRAPAAGVVVAGDDLKNAIEQMQADPLPPSTSSEDTRIPRLRVRLPRGAQGLPLRGRLRPPLLPVHPAPPHRLLPRRRSPEVVPRERGRPSPWARLKAVLLPFQPTCKGGAIIPGTGPIPWKLTGLGR